MSNSGTPRIVYFVGGFGVGGTERHLSLVLPALKRRGWDIVVFQLGADGPMSAPLIAAGIEIKKLPAIPLVSIPKIGGLSAIFSQIRTCRREIKKSNATVMHSFLGTPGIIAWLVHALGAQAKFIFSKRNQLARPDLFFGEGWLEAHAMRRADVVLAHSREVLNEVISIGVSQDHAHLVHNGIDPAPYHAARTKRKELRNKFGWTDQTIMVMLANLIPYKGHKSLILALKQLHDNPKTKENWRLVFAGHGDVAFEREIRELAKQIGIEERIEFLGHRDDVPDILAASDIGLLLSRHEGFSNAILEYMASGLPTIATAVGGNLDSVIHNKTGYLVTLDDAQSLNEAISRLVSDNKTRKAMGTCAQKTVLHQFSLDACLDGYENVYRELLK